MNSSIAMAPAPSNPASAPNLAGRIFQILHQERKQLFPEVLQQWLHQQIPALATPPPMMKASGTSVYIRFMIRQPSISAVSSHN